VRCMPMPFLEVLRMLFPEMSLCSLCSLNCECHSGASHGNCLDISPDVETRKIMLPFRDPSSKASRFFMGVESLMATGIASFYSGYLVNVLLAYSNFPSQAT
jgi:hypothetical protein